ncbi:MAG: hypothetical protein NTZ02_01710 [Candidatus Woesearchaeota archaeon]|nr:hypothetical protein [Candidatus Woesearchaeota archaeon]
MSSEDTLRVLNLADFDSTSIDDYLNGTGYAKAGDSEGDNFFCDEMRDFLIQAKKCGTSVVKIEDNKVYYNVENIPEDLKYFESHLAYAVIKVAKSIATIKAIEEKPNKKLLLKALDTLVDANYFLNISSVMEEFYFREK